MDARFPPEARLHDGRDYSRVFRRQQKAASGPIVVLASPRSRDAAGAPRRARLGIMIPVKAVKTAVRRHELKRWVRECFRTRMQETAAGYDLVVLFRSDAADHRRLDEDLLRLAAKAMGATAEGRPRGRGRPPQGKPAQRDGPARPAPPGTTGPQG